MKKIISFILSVSFLFQMIIPVNASNLNDNREMIYENDYITKFIATENNNEYTVVLDRINNLCIIDDKVYSINQMLSAYDGTDNLYTSLLNSDYIYLNDLDYDSMFEETNNYILDLHPASHGENIPTTRCNFCGLGQTVPRSGYNSKGYVVVLKQYGGVGSLIFSNSATFVESLVAKLGIAVKRAALIKTSLVSMGIVAGMMILSGRTVKQYTHKTCPLAIKEEDLVEAGTNEKGKIYNVTDTRYFFNGKPY